MPRKTTIRRIKRANKLGTKRANKLGTKRANKLRTKRANKLGTKRANKLGTKRAIWKGGKPYPDAYLECCRNRNRLIKELCDKLIKDENIVHVNNPDISNLINVINDKITEFDRETTNDNSSHGITITEEIEQKIQKTIELYDISSEKNIQLYIKVNQCLHDIYNAFNDLQKYIPINNKSEYDELINQIKSFNKHCNVFDYKFKFFTDTNYLIELNVGHIKNNVIEFGLIYGRLYGNETKNNIDEDRVFMATLSISNTNNIDEIQPDFQTSMFYAGLVGRFLNKQQKFFHIFTYTHCIVQILNQSDIDSTTLPKNLIKYVAEVVSAATDDEYNKLHNKLKDLLMPYYINPDTRTPLMPYINEMDNMDTIIERTPDAIKHGLNFGVITTYYKKNIKIDAFFNDTRTPENIHHTMYALYHVYMTLHSLRDVFTHYNLHMENVLLCEIPEQKYIEYHYHVNDNENSTVFRSKYMTKIIDYGMCYYNDNGDQTDYGESKRFYENVVLKTCKQMFDDSDKEKNNQQVDMQNTEAAKDFAHDYGYTYFLKDENADRGEMYINPIKSNQSMDLLLLHTLKLFSTNAYKTKCQNEDTPVTNYLLDHLLDRVVFGVVPNQSVNEPQMTTENNQNTGFTIPNGYVKIINDNDCKGTFNNTNKGYNNNLSDYSTVDFDKYFKNSIDDILNNKDGNDEKMFNFQINNVTDMFNILNDWLRTTYFVNYNNETYNNNQKYGELHIYGNGKESKWMPS